MRKALHTVIFLLGILAILVGGYQYYLIEAEDQAGIEVYEEIEQVVTVAEEAEEKILQPNEPPMIDFAALKAINEDVVGWLYSANTPINYPILQGESNETYLRTMIDGRSNRSGSIFMDYRNEKDYSDDKTIIYGHNMQNSKMFGSLPKYKSQEYYDQHKNLWLVTEEKVYRLDVLSCYSTKADAEDYKLIVSKEELEEYKEEIVRKSTVGTEVALSEVERIVVLSTCTYEKEDSRFIVICSLVEITE